MLELHPLCTLFPRLSGPEFDSLVADIRENSQREPIVVHDGMILDGGNRYRACLEAGVEPQTMAFGGGDLVSFVLSANLHRRHLSPGQQAAIVASAQDWAKAQTRGGDRGNQHAVAKVDQSTLATVATRASAAGVGRDTQLRADKVAKADPALAKKVAHGEISLPEAVRQVTGKPKKIKEPAPVIDKTDELAEARDTIRSLAEENDLLRDKLAVAAIDGTTEGQAEAGAIIAELREHVRQLEIEVDGLKASRDTYMRESAERLKQIKHWKKEATK